MDMRTSGSLPKHLHTSFGTALPNKSHSRYVTGADGQNAHRGESDFIIDLKTAKLTNRFFS